MRGAIQTKLSIKTVQRALGLPLHRVIKYALECGLAHHYSLRFSLPHVRPEQLVEFLARLVWYIFPSPSTKRNGVALNRRDASVYVSGDSITRGLHFEAWVSVSRRASSRFASSSTLPPGSSHSSSLSMK